MHFLCTHFISGSTFGQLKLSGYALVYVLCLTQITNIIYILFRFRLFSSRRCDRCGTGISSSELVMRARELVFHIGCFSCILCGAQLSTGDTAAVRGGRVFCGEHYDADILR